MEYRQIAQNLPPSSVLGFGCARIASLTTRYPPREIEAVLLEGFDGGINFFDTADIYGQGDSERLLGRLFRGKRDRVLFCSKAGLTLGALPQLAVRLVKPVLNPLLRRTARRRESALNVRRAAVSQCFAPDYIQGQIEGSLRRLRTDHLDVFLLHDPPMEVIARGDIFARLSKLQRAGSLRAYGVSCGEPTDAIQALDHPGVSFLQLAVNRNTLPDLDETLARVHAAGKVTIARECLGDGVLARQGESSGMDAVRRVLQPLLARPEIGVVLIGMLWRQHLREHLAALA